MIERGEKRYTSLRELSRDAERLGVDIMFKRQRDRTLIYCKKRTEPISIFTQCGLRRY